MAFTRPTLQTIVQRIQSDIDGRLAGADSFIVRSLLYVIAKAVAGVVHGLYGHQDWLSKQIIPDTAEVEFLDRHAAWWNVVRKAASSAVGNVTFTGTDGSIIPAGTILQRSDGEQFTTDVEVTITAGSIVAAVTAVVPGQNSNTIAATTVALVSPIVGVNSSAIVDGSALTGGADIEGDDDLRDRLRERIQKTPQGGAVADYEQWALEIGGVTRVWVLPNLSGLGTVGVYFVRDDDASIIPDAAEVLAVQDYIDTVRPVTADATIYAPTEVAQAMTIQISPNTSAVQAAISTSLTDLFRREAQVEDGAGSGTVLLSHINEAISIATGEDNHILVSPVADVALSTGELATLGAITWQAIP